MALANITRMKKVEDDRVIYHLSFLPKKNDQFFGNQQHVNQVCIDKLKEISNWCQEKLENYGEYWAFSNNLFLFLNHSDSIIFEIAWGLKDEPFE